MGIWFRKDPHKKWHLAACGNAIAECGRNIHIAAAYANERMVLDVDNRGDRKDLCQACINSILWARAYIKKLDEDYEARNLARKKKPLNATVIGSGYKPYINKDKHEPETMSEMILDPDKR